MKGNVALIGIIVAALVGALVFVYIQKPLEERSNPPNPIYIAPDVYQYKFCPPSLTFFSLPSEEYFKINYKNTGSTSGSFSVTLTSDNDKILSRYEGDLEGFRTIATKGWFVEAGQPQDFKFKIKINSTEYPNNFTMIAELTCKYDTSLQKGLTCQGMTSCCKYSKPQFGNQYSLKSETC